MNKVLIGHCLEVLQQILTGSVHATITSPPYFCLRDYGLEPVYWPAVTFSPMAGLPPLTIPEQVCCLGLEGDIWSYVGHLVAVFREVKRVMRDDGVLWLNLGDSYASGGGFGGQGKTGIINNTKLSNKQGRAPVTEELKPKDLMGIPWRVAYALQADGWWLRSDIIWAKPNPMPESVTDRPTKAHEYVFLLSKGEKYFYDAEAIKENSVDPEGSSKRYESPFFVGNKHESGGYSSNGAKHTGGMKQFSGTRNRRTVWTAPDEPPFETFQDWLTNKLSEDTELYNALIDEFEEEQSNKSDVWQIATKPYSAAHFATFPPKLIEPMILASTSQEGVCGECGNPWRRVVEKESKPKGRSSNEVYTGQAYGNNPQSEVWGPNKNLGGNPLPVVTTGWQPTCTHNAPIVPAVILDPFFGSGTTGEVAIKHRRNCIGIEANPAYGEGLVGDRLDGVQIVMGLEP